MGDHGVPGAAPQVGPRHSQLYPLPKTFVFLILCLLIFLIQKIKRKPGALWNKVWGWVRGGLCEEVWPCFQEGCSDSEQFLSLFSHTLPAEGLLSLLDLRLIQTLLPPLALPRLPLSAEGDVRSNLWLGARASTTVGQPLRQGETARWCPEAVEDSDFRHHTGEGLKVFGG